MRGTYTTSLRYFSAILVWGLWPSGKRNLPLQASWENGTKRLKSPGGGVGRGWPRLFPPENRHRLDKKFHARIFNFFFFHKKSDETVEKGPRQAGEGPSLDQAGETPSLDIFKPKGVGL